jgi:hypothetical protein
VALGQKRWNRHKQASILIAEPKHGGGDARSTNITGEQEDKGCLQLKADTQPVTELNPYADVGIHTDKASLLQATMDLANHSNSSTRNMRRKAYIES